MCNAFDVVAIFDGSSLSFTLLCSWNTLLGNLVRALKSSDSVKSFIMNHIKLITNFIRYYPILMMINIGHPILCPHSSVTVVWESSCSYSNAAGVTQQKIKGPIVIQILIIVYVNDNKKCRGMLILTGYDFDHPGISTIRVYIKPNEYKLMI